MCKKLFFWLVLCACLSLGLVSVSESQAGPAYKRFYTNNPNNQHWRDGLELFLQTDVERCKKAYGDRWPNECEAPWPGKEGNRVEGIVMTPKVNGVWRWTSGSAMKFTPAKHLAPNTTYTLNLENVEMSSRIQVVKKFTYTTPPQAVNIGKQTLWIDPSVKSKHVLSVPLTFIYPVNRDLVEKSINISGPQGSLRLGAPQYAWNNQNDFVVLNIPILQLPEKNTQVSLRINGFQGYTYIDGSRSIQSGNKSKFVEAQATITGSDNLMDVRSAEIKPIYDDNLGRGFELVLTTSLQTKPQDILEKLDLLLLPQKNLAKATRNCNWEAMPAISADDIKNSQKIKATLMQPADEVATEIHLKLPVEAGRGILCAVKPGLRSTSGLTLNRVKRFIKNVPTLSPEINFLQPGNILPLHSGQKLDLHTVGVDRLVWRVEMIRKPFLALLGKKTDFNTDAEINYDTISDVKSGSINLKADLYKPNYTALDLTALEGEKQGQSSLMHLTITGYVGDEEKCQASRLILLSDLGLMLKTAANGSQHVFVRKLSSADPVKGCKVMVLGTNGVPVLSGTTNDQGRCDLPSSYGLTREKKPQAIVAILGQDLAWLSLGEFSNTVDYGDFATQGRHASEQGLLASVFSQRGIYMPGETLHFGAIITNQDYQAEAKKLAVTAVIYEPSGKEVYREKLTPSKDGLVTLSWKSNENGATGTYRLDLGIDLGHNDLEVFGSTQVKVEEFQPDTLALRLAYAGQKPQGWILVAPKAQSQVKVNLDNLYGEPARNHRIKARLETNPSTLTFKGYEDFTFADLGVSGESQDLELPDTFTNEQGEALLSLPLDKLALGTRRGLVLVEGFEKSGGRAVGRSLPVLFSPKPYVLGYKPEGEANTLNYLSEASKANLRLIVLDNYLKAKQLDNVTVKVSARRFVTSLVSDSQGLYRYDATPVDTEIGSKKITIAPNGTLLDLDTKVAGDYLLSVIDSNGETLAAIPYSVAGTKLAKPGEEPVLVNGTLALKLAKENYTSGEKVKFRISVPYSGTGLVTLERDSVLAHAWFKAEPGESVHEITIPKDFEGRGYINVSFVRGLESQAIYMNPHCYAVAPINCGLAKHEMGLTLKAQEQVKPGQEVTVEVFAKKPGHVQLFAVDEGVLQLTNYKTPNPLYDLLIDRALDVKTRQAFDLLMPDHERLRGRIPGFGGGMGSGGGRFLNPFRRKAEPPFAYWSKVLEVSPNGTKVSFKVPSYFSGSLKIMAVGSAVDSNGLLAASSAQTKATVRGELIIKPALPLVVAPNDTFEGGVVIANTVAGSGANAKVALDIVLPKGLSLTTNNQKVLLTIPENEERAVNLGFKVGDTLGAQNFEFRAHLENDSKVNARTQSLSIRPAQPKLRTERTAKLSALPKDNNGAYFESNREMYTYDASTTLTVAAAPILSLRSILERLDNYPFDCTEQKISRAIPYVVLWDRPSLRDKVLGNSKRSLKEQLKIGEENISEAIAAIRASLQYDGVSIWPGSHDSNLFVTAYAADFLQTMREHGLGCPADLMERLTSILEDRVSAQPFSIEDGRYKIYATWVLQRDGRIMTSVLKSLEDWFTKNARNWERDVLTSLLADSYAALRLTRQAEKILPKDVIVTSDPLFSTGMARAMHALIILKDFGSIRDATPIVHDLQDAVLRPSATTVDLAMAARALAELSTLKNLGSDLGLKLDCTSYQPGFFGPQQNENLEGLSLVAAAGCKRFNVKAQGHDSGLELAVLLTEDGFDRKSPTAAQGKGFEVSKQLLNTQGLPVKELELGDVVTSKICVRSLGKSVSNSVILDLVPGGLEPVLEKTPLEQGEGFLRYERREDRGLFFVDLTTEEHCYQYRMRAATKGHFVVPATQVQGMYQPELNGTSGAATLDIH